MNDSEKTGLSVNVLIGGVIILLVALPYVGRILWEETILTCRQGPQLVGFSMAHTMPIFMLLGMLGMLMAHVWLIVVCYHAFWKHVKFGPLDRLLVVSLISTIALSDSPERGWEYLMGRICGPRQSAAELFVKGDTVLDRYLLAVVIDKQGNVNQPVRGRRTLLGIATVHDDPAAVRMLIAHGANVNALDGHSAPLNEAAEAGDFEIVKLLIEAGADPNQPDLAGFTPAGRASVYGHENIARYLDSRSATRSK